MCTNSFLCVSCGFVFVCAHLSTLDDFFSSCVFWTAVSQTGEHRTFFTRPARQLIPNNIFIDYEVIFRFFSMYF